MYLRTPKRYQPGRRRRHLRLISRRTLLTVLIIGAAAVTGRYIWMNQEQVRSSVLPQIEGAVDEVANAVQTQVAPHPTPSPTPDLAAAQSGCLEAYYEGNLEQAIVQCTLLAENSPNDLATHYKLARLLVITSNYGRDAKRIAQALVYADKTINADPEAPDGWAVMALALDWKGDYGPALAAAFHAKALDENYAPTYAFLGGIYYDLGQVEVAKGYVDEAIQLDVQGIAVADSFRNKALIQTAELDYEEAIQSYQVALQKAPSDTYIVIELASTYVSLGQIDTAISVLGAALERSPNDPLLLWALGRVYVRNGMPEKAYEYYRRCLDSHPDNVPCLSYLGGLQLSDGDYVTAIANLQRAIELGSTDPDDYLELGRALSSLGRCAEAKPYLRQGYQITVDNENVDKQTSFVNALQQCGELIAQPSALTPTPEPSTQE
jgi:tetratricopeptide (TPR) repeat protein